MIKVFKLHKKIILFIAIELFFVSENLLCDDFQKMAQFQFQMVQLNSVRAKSDEKKLKIPEIETKPKEICEW